MPFTKHDDGGLHWDRQAARLEGRWSQAAREKMARCAWIEVAEGLIERGAIMRVFDTLGDPAHRPADLTAEDERFIARRALAKGSELGRLDSSMVSVLLRLIPGDDRLRGETRDPSTRRAIRAAIEADPTISNSQLARVHKTARSTVAGIRADVLR